MQGNINIPDSTITTNLSFRQLVLMNMQQLTNFPYIEKDFDALTDYELLCLVVKFLNDVIANQNEQNNSITRMYESFLALQDYVNNTKDELEDAFNNLDDYVRNYFDNLDVQEEINNKLDKMLEDGVLEQIIEQFLQSTAIWCFDTVADMKLATNLINGSFAKTLGYHSINDGGSSLYKIRTKTNEDIADEKFLIALYDNTLIAELIYNDTISIKQLGLTEESTDIGADINIITNTKNKTAYVPYGNFNVTTTIHPETNKTIIIDGALTYTGSDSCIKIDTPRNIIKTKNITSNSYCILFENNTTSAQCQNNNIELNGLIRSTTTHCLYFHSIDQGICYNNIKFNSLSAEDSSYCIYIKTESTGTYSRFVAESTIKGGQCTSGLYAIYIDTGTTGGTGEVTGMHFETISCEGVTNGVFIKNARSNNFDYIRVGELTGHYIKIDSNARNNVFNILSNITHDKIDLSTASTNGNYLNIINGNYAAAGGLYLASRVVLTRKVIQLQNLVNRAYKNVNTVPYTFTNDEARYYILITANEGTIKLNEYYGVNGINEFWVKSSRTFTLTDKDDNVICTGTAGPTNYLFHCVCYDQDGTYKWIVDKKEA